MRKIKLSPDLCVELLAVGTSLLQQAQLAAFLPLLAASTARPLLVSAGEEGGGTLPPFLL